MEPVVLIILGSALLLAVASLCVTCAFLAKTSGKSDAVLAKELSKMSDRVVVEHGLQLDRIRKENELELGVDYNKSQREIARFRGSEPGDNPRPRPSITVDEEAPL